MSWLDKILPPKIKREGKGESAVPEGLWHKMPGLFRHGLRHRVAAKRQSLP